MKKVILLTCALLIMLSGFISCNSDNNTASTKNSSFSISRGCFEVSGDTKGYAAGGTHDLNLSIRNDTDEEWSGSCYIFLVDQNGPFMDISNCEFNLPHEGDQESWVIKMTLPADIESGAYGLALLFPGKDHIVQTIYIGDEISNEPVGSWPDISSYKQITYEATYEDFVVGESTRWIASAHVGETVIVTLGSNPTTGFKWSDTAEIQDQLIIRQMNHKYIEPEQTEVAGAAGKEVWTFKALNKGTTTISMEYRRSWESAEKTGQTFVATITIE